jgi:hypothetical protein
LPIALLLRPLIALALPAAPSFFPAPADPINRIGAAIAIEE